LFDVDPKIHHQALFVVSSLATALREMRVPGKTEKGYRCPNDQRMGNLTCKALKTSQSHVNTWLTDTKNI